jgi:hypothetical protein
MVKCPFCQFDNEDGALFCEQCKSDLGSVQAAAPPMPPPIPPAMPEPVPMADVIEEHHDIPTAPVVAPPEPPPIPMAAEVVAPPIPDIPPMPPPVPMAEVPPPPPVMPPAPEPPPPVPAAHDIPAPPLAPVEAPPVLTPVAPPPAPAAAAPPPPAAAAPPPAPAAPPAPAPAAPAQAAPAPARLPADAKPRLFVMRGQKINQEFPIYEGHNFIGRADEKPVDIDLEDQEPPEKVWCSRQHALINFEDGVITIEDLNSANGTYVNRARIYPGQKRQLNPNDVIQIGTVHLKVKI